MITIVKLIVKTMITIVKLIVKTMITIVKLFVKLITIATFDNVFIVIVIIVKMSITNVAILRRK